MFIFPVNSNLRSSLTAISIGVSAKLRSYRTALPWSDVVTDQEYILTENVMFIFPVNSNLRSSLTV
jgi:hypothetical protein